MEISLNNAIGSITHQLQIWRRDFHQYAESGWFEFRTATLVADELDRLGYQLQLGKEVINAEDRMGLPHHSNWQSKKNEPLSKAR